MSLTFSYDSPNTGEATVTGHTNRSNVTSIDIPDTVTYQGTTYNVTSIDTAAFEVFGKLQSVTIGDNVTSIGKFAFYNCYKLQSVTIGDSVTSIGEDAFYNCNTLQSVTIPDSVRSIGKGAFEGCDVLESVTIGDNVTSIGDYAFYNCYKLQSVTIGDSVTSIGSSAFRNCNELQSVTIPDSVTSIGISAFESCDALESVTIGDNVTSIGNYTFYNCNKLHTVTVTSNNKLGYTKTTNNVSFYGATVTVVVIILIQFDLDNVSGYMNVFDLNNDGTKGGLIFGSNWGLPALQYTETDGIITMKPNVNGYNDNPGDSFWRNNDGAGPDGNKFIEASAFNDTNSISALPNQEFNFYVVNNTLNDRYTFEMYALLFDRYYSIITEKAVNMNSPGKYTLTLDDSFDNDNGVLLQYGFRMKGINANPDTDWGSVKLSATPTPPNNPPQFDSDAPTTATEDVLYTYTPQVSDPDDGDSLTITAPTLPGWLTFDGTTLSGTPTQSNSGANTVKLVVSDGTDTAEQEITIVVTPVNDAPVFTSAPVTSATAGLPYSYQPQVSDEENNTLTEITVGTLPEWLTFESGVLSGTPPLNADKLTDIELTVSETDTAEKLSTKQNFTITLKYDVKTIEEGEYHKLPASGLGDSGEGFDFSVKQLVITTSTSTYNPTWYGAKTIIETDKVLPYEDGKVLVRDSRLNNANDSEIKQIAAEWAIQNNHYNFYYDTRWKTIFINESVAGNYILKDNSRYNTVFINQKREQVFGGRVILKERYVVDFVMNEESTHQIDVSKILHQPAPLQLIPFEFPTWLKYDLVDGVYTLTGKPTDSKTQLAKINVKGTDGNTYVLTVHIKVELYNESKLVGKQFKDLTRDYETEFL